MNKTELVATVAEKAETRNMRYFDSAIKTSNNTKIVTRCEAVNGVCDACLYADTCGFCQGLNEYVPTIEVSLNEKSMALCEGRHEIPQAVDGSIFGNELDPLAIEKMEATASARLDGVDVLNLYVTGLTVALVAVLNVCRDNGIKVTLYHFDRATGGYYPQVVR